MKCGKRSFLTTAKRIVALCVLKRSPIQVLTGPNAA
jgi:hypothetical protein